MAAVLPVTRQIGGSGQEITRASHDLCVAEVHRCLIVDRLGVCKPFSSLFQHNKAIIVFVRVRERVLVHIPCWVLAWLCVTFSHASYLIIILWDAMRYFLYVIIIMHAFTSLENHSVTCLYLIPRGLNLFLFWFNYVSVFGFSNKTSIAQLYHVYSRW